MRNARGATGALARAVLASGERLSGPRYAALARIAVHDDSGGGARGEVAAATAAAAAASRKGASSSSLDAELSELVLNDGGIDATLRWLTAAREPSTAAFVPLIEAAVSCGDDDALLAAGGLMRKRGVRPDAALYTALILGRLRLGQTERALSACDKCLSDGVVPESRALTALVRALADASETEAAISLCRRLRRQPLAATRPRRLGPSPHDQRESTPPQARLAAARRRTSHLFAHRRRRALLGGAVRGGGGDAGARSCSSASPRLPLPLGFISAPSRLSLSASSR